jgi:hypothetical protein
LFFFNHPWNQWWNLPACRIHSADTPHTISDRIIVNAWKSPFGHRLLAQKCPTLTSTPLPFSRFAQSCAEKAEVWVILFSCRTHCSLLNFCETDSHHVQTAVVRERRH